MMLPLLDQFNQRRLVCERCAQGCPINAPSLMMVHSSYDITAEQLADAIDSANALEAMCVMMFYPKILVDKSGVIAEQDCIWRVSRDPETKKKLNFQLKMILLWILNMILILILHSANRRHCVLVLVTIIFVKLLIIDLDVYMYIVHIVKNLVKHVPRSVVSHNIWLLNEEKVMVKYCDYGVHSSAGTTGERLRFQYKQVRFLVGKKMFDFALTHLLCLNSTKFSIQAVLEYVRSLNSRVIVNGVDVVGGERIPVEQFEWFCSALYVEAYRRRWMGNGCWEKCSPMKLNRDPSLT